MKKLEDQLKSSNTMTTGRSNEINDLSSRRDELRSKKQEIEEEKKRLEQEETELVESISKYSRKRDTIKLLLDETRGKVQNNTLKTNENEVRKTRQLEDIEAMKRAKEEALKEKDISESERLAITRKLEANEKIFKEGMHMLQQTENQIQRQEKDEIELKRKENDQISLRNKLLVQAKEKQMELEKLVKSHEKLTKDTQLEQQEVNKKQVDL